MARLARLCVTNQKGGVGKTTVAITLAGALSQRNRNVLFVDLDPQGNGTEGLGLTDAYNAAPPTLFDALVDDSSVSFDELVWHHDEMDVLPSNIDMTAAEASLLQLDDGEQRLAQLLDAADHGYDYVIVDCPPHLGMLTDNALYAAPNLVIPALAESTSKRSLELLFDYTRAFEMEHDVQIDAKSLVVNRIENTGEATEMLEWFEEAVPDVPTFEVRKRVALQRAFSSGRSIFAADEEIDMCERFRAVAASLDEEFSTTEMTV
ncbi:ParA family protein [Haloterrigena salina]|uniref:ParA family protein n=1 Tax=Haloterrigena salina TaxID=504937 RepID=UPI00067767C3|nr:ParA family protein [Haloterrigena salina]